MANYKLLALDLDGTTLTQEKLISEKDRLWISKAKKAGVIIILATGRGGQGVKKYLKELGLDTPLVLANGGDIRVNFNNILQQNFIKKDDIYRLHKIAEGEKVQYTAYNGEYSVKTEEWNKSMFDKDWINFSMMHEKFKVMKRIREKLKEFQLLEITSSAPVNVETSLKGISKAYGVQKICEYLGIRMKDVMAIGDNENDTSLVTSAGLGIAMKNADETLKEEADEVINYTNDENGVAKCIEKFLL